MNNSSETLPKAISAPFAFLPRLSPRERTVLYRLACGQLDKQIAAGLGISYWTVKLHVRHILAKLGCCCRTEAAVAGWTGLLPPYRAEIVEARRVR